MYWWRSLSKSPKKMYFLYFIERRISLTYMWYLVEVEIRSVKLSRKLHFKRESRYPLLHLNIFLLYLEKRNLTIPFQDSLKFAIVIFVNVTMYRVDQRDFWATQIRLKYQRCLLIAENFSVVNNSMKNCRTVKRERWSQKKKKKRLAVSHVLDTLCEYILHASATTTSLNREK